MDVHWATRGEDARKIFHYLWVECKKNYIRKQKLKKHLINYHCFVGVEDGGKGGETANGGSYKNACNHGKGESKE